MQVTDNKSVYSTVEFESWAHRNRLITAERFLIERYLDKQGTTLEAGTGGGKILFAMKELGFEHLFGFDFVPAFIEQAKKRDVEGAICFEVGDAVHLEYQDSSFDQIIYLQQILCCLENEASRLKALGEAHRVLRPGGTALFSVLSLASRIKSLEYWPFLAYLYFLRTIRRSKADNQSLPWLRMGGTFNFRSLLDQRPYVYWYKTEEICDLLSHVGFEITAVGSAHQIDQGTMCERIDLLMKQPIKGMLYIVCKKRATEPGTQR